MKNGLGSLLLLLAVAAPVAAQGNAQCATYGSVLPGGPSARNVCNAAVDGATLFMPVAGILTTAGNPFLGSAGGMGRFPHLGVTLRVNGTSVVVPDVTYDGSTTTVGAKQTVFAPAPLVEAALGLVRGTRSGAFAIDVLGSAQLLPTKLIDDVHVDVNARSIGSIALGLGYGGRLTLVGPHGAVPGITVSIMHRSLPRIGVGDLVAGDRYAFASDLNSTDYRLVAGMHVGPLALGAGIGRNSYTAAADIFFTNPVTGAQQTPIHLDLVDDRDLAFVDGGLGAGSFYLVGEAGVQRGRDLGLVTTFAGNDPKANRLFASLGLRLGL